MWIHEDLTLENLWYGTYVVLKKAQIKPANRKAMNQFILYVVFVLQRRKAQYESDRMNSGHHTLTLGKLGKKK